MVCLYSHFAIILFGPSSSLTEPFLSTCPLILSQLFPLAWMGCFFLDIGGLTNGHITEENDPPFPQQPLTT